MIASQFSDSPISTDCQAFDLAIDNSDEGSRAKKHPAAATVLGEQNMDKDLFSLVYTALCSD